MDNLFIVFHEVARLDLDLGGPFFIIEDSIITKQSGKF